MGFEQNDPEQHSSKYKSQRTHYETSRRLDGVIDTDDKGRIHFPNKEWFNLTVEEKAFFQKWNGNVKNGDPVDALIPPQGITILITRHVVLAARTLTELGSQLKMATSIPRDLRRELLLTSKTLLMKEITIDSLGKIQTQSLNIMPINFNDHAVFDKHLF